MTPKSQSQTNTGQSLQMSGPSQPLPVTQPINSNMSGPRGNVSQGQPHGGGDSPFMQHQSQIFVFSTNMANEAAESVLLGQYKDLISYHLDNPSTKKFLQVTFIFGFVKLYFRPIY